MNPMNPDFEDIPDIAPTHDDEAGIPGVANDDALQPPPVDTASTGTTSTGVLVSETAGANPILSTANLNPIRSTATTTNDQVAINDLLIAITTMTTRFEQRFAELEANAVNYRIRRDSEEDASTPPRDQPTSTTAETPLRGIESVRFPESRRKSGVSESMANTPGDEFNLPGMEAPIMGTRLSESCVIVGGKPLADWSGLAGTSASTPNCRRFVPGTSAEERAYKERCTPPDDLKLTKKCDIYDAMSLLTNHAKTHGLDTVLYVPDPDDPSKVLFVPQHYSRLNHLLMKGKVIEWTAKWDSYDKENDAALVVLLRSAIDKDIRTAINPYLDFEELPASVILMLICNEIKPQTVLSYDTDRAALMRKNIKSYTGHDVKKFCEAIRPELRRLEQAHEMTKNVLIWLVNSFIAVNLMGFSDVIRQAFFDPLIETFSSLGDYTQTQLMQTLRSKNLHWEQLLDKATLIYTNMKAAGHWKWTESKDSKASPQQFYLNELADEPKTQKLVANIIAAAKDKKPVCFKCGKIGVKAPDCPDCKKEKEKGEKSKEKKGDSKNKPKGIDHPAPKEGEKPIKIVDNRLYFWCPECNRWESTHYPKDHGKEGSKIPLSDLIRIKKEFKADGKLPPEFNFCQFVTDEGINL